MYELAGTIDKVKDVEQICIYEFYDFLAFKRTRDDVD